MPPVPRSLRVRDVFARWSLLALVAGCGPGEQLEKDLAVMREELTAQRRQQAALLSRIERLEAGAAVRAPQAVLPVAPVRVDPLDGLPVVRLSPTTSNPAAAAPPLDTRIALQEPSEEILSSLEAKPADLTAGLERNDAQVEIVFAQAVRRYNEGAWREAGTALQELARAHPRHVVADNALYLAGMARVVTGECPGAMNLFSEVVQTYADGDAAAPAMLGLGQCAAAEGRAELARGWLERIVREHPRTPESTQAEAALADLARERN